jgi:hypothetical protein
LDVVLTVLCSESTAETVSVFGLPWKTDNVLNISIS